MSDTAHEVQPGLTDSTQPGRPLQTNQTKPSPEETSSLNASEAIEEVPRDEPQQQAHTAAPPETGVDPTPPTEKIDWWRWKEIIGNLEVEKLLEERKNVCTEEEKAKAWNYVADTVKTYSDDMIERWNKQIDVYLVFAGLFSAILTAFNVQSYPLLQQTTPDPTAVALQQISLQLQSFAISPPFVNSTHPAIAAAAIPPSTPSPVPPYAIWLNILWFSGLILSLASTVIGILVKQWLGEYSSGLTGNSREAARLRQYRLNNLVKWRVGGIIVLIPVLLLLSLALFLAGLLILLWNLHSTVAVVASVLIGVLAVSTVCVTLLPVFKPSCAYLSPQTLVLITLFWHAIPLAAKFGLAILTILPSFMLNCCIRVCRQLLHPRRHHDTARGEHDFEFMEVVEDSMLWLDSVFSFIPIPTWRGLERSVVNRLNNALDIDILIQAYDSTLDANAVSFAAVCLLEQPSGAVVNYSFRLYNCAYEHFGDNGSGYPKNNLLAGQALICTVDVMEPFGMTEESMPNPFFTFRSSTPLDILPSSLSAQTSAQNAWFWLRASLEAVRGRFLWQRDNSEFLSYCQQAIQEPVEERLQEFFKDTRCSQPGDIAILRRETDRCLRLATTPHVQSAVVKYTHYNYFKVYLYCLRSVDEYLWYAARVLGSTDSSRLEDPDAIRKNTCDILRKFESAVNDLSFLWQYRKDVFEQDSDYRDHLRRQCDVLNILNSEHEIFRSISAFNKELRLIIYDALFNLNLQMKQEQTRAGRRDTEASPSSEDVDAALARYKDLYLL